MKTPWLKARFRSFYYAGKGIAKFIRSEANVRIHLFAAMWVVIFGIYFGVTPTEWAILLLCIGLVLSAEALNTAIECAVDLACPHHHPMAAKAKDVAAGAVLIAAATAAVVGLIIFVPYFATMLN